MSEAALLAKGQGASPGRATGPLALSSESAFAFAAAGTPAILVCVDASAEDAPGVRAAAALVTTRGGITGDGAIIARALGKPCVSSCAEVLVRAADKRIVVRDVTVAEGEPIAIDGASGEIRRG
jgi:pyruvate,orthophosphate dikinase